MIKSFKHKGLKLLWVNNDASKLPSEYIKIIRRILDTIHEASVVPQDLLVFKSWRIHPLKGSLKGYWSLDVSGNYRIIFRFENGNAYDIDYADTH